MDKNATKKNIAMEYAVYIFRRLLEDGKITRREFEKAVNGFVLDMDTVQIAS